MDSRNYLHREFFANSNESADLSKPNLPLDVRITPNYFKFNPIFCVDGLPVEDKIIIDNNTFNVIVPISLKPYNDFIFSKYLELFYFNKVTVDNIYYDELGMELNATSMEQLNVNIIYVQDNQTYFTFNTLMNLEENINIIDPIVMVYTGSENPSFLFSSFTNSYFIYSEAPNVHKELSPILERYNLLRVLPRFESVYEENSKVILRISRDYIKNIAFVILLIIMSVIITFTFLLNHIERNRYKIYVKSLFGYDFLRRNKGFIASLFTYSTITAVILIMILDVAILPFLLCFLAIDMLTYFFIEQFALSKLFSSIIKGEH